jgi:hypothetical protein
VVGAEAAQLALALADLAVELVDQPQAGLDRGLPRLGQVEPGEQPAAADAEQIGDGAGLAVGEQHRVHALLEAGAMADEVESPAGALPLGAHSRVGQPDRRHQVAPCELGQDPGVDPVGLAGQRRQALHLLRVGDLDLPAGQLEPVVHEAGAVHRLDSVACGRLDAAGEHEPRAQRDRPQPPEQGTVWVTTGVHPKRVVLTVENTGEKLTPDVVATPVEPFLRGPSAHAPTTQVSA